MVRVGRGEGVDHAGVLFFTFMLGWGALSDQLGELEGSLLHGMAILGLGGSSSVVAARGCCFLVGRSTWVHGSEVG